MTTPLDSPRIPSSLLWIALAISLALAGWSARNRIPWSDEGLFSSASHNLAFHGFMGTTVVDPSLPGLTRIDRRTYMVMPLFLLGQALWYQVFPHTVLGSRAFSIFWAPVAALAFRLFLARLFPRTSIPSLAFILLVTSYIFIDVAAFSRPDMMCLALGLCGLASFLSLRDRSLPLALFVSNAFVAASGMTHPNGIFHFVALCVVVLWFDRRRLNFVSVAAAACPYLIFGALWSLYILQDKQAFIDQFGANGANGGNDRLPRSWNPVSLVLSEIRDRYFYVFGLVTRGFSLFKLAALFAYIGSILFCVLNRDLRSLPGVRLLLILFISYFTAMCLFNQKLSYYIINILPVYVALLAVAICYLWGRWPKLHVPIIIAILGLISIETSGIVIRAVTRSYIKPQREAVAYINAHSRPGDSIYATCALIFTR